MNNDQFLLHKLENIFDVEISRSYEDETGYYVQINDEWKKISYENIDKKTTSKIEKMISELNSSQE